MRKRASSVGPSAKAHENVPKVLFITPWYGGAEGGVAVISEAMVHAFHDQGVECTVIQVVGDGWRPRERRGAVGERIVTLCVRAPHTARGWRGRIGALIRGRITGRFLRRLVRDEGYSVAHFHYAIPPYARLSELCRAAGFRIVVTFHGSDLEVNTTHPETHYAIDRLLAASSAVTTVSNALQHTLLRHFPAVRPISTVVYNPVPPLFVRRITALPPMTRDIQILFVGNLIHRKGVDILLRAIALVRDAARPESHSVAALFAEHSPAVVIAGEGAGRAALEALAHDLGLGDIVQFIGRQSRIAIPPLFARARILVVPSRSEALGVVALEAQFAGVGVIASNVGGLPEVVTDQVNGLLVPPDDPPALADALQRLLTDETRRLAFVAAGRDHIKRSFTPSTVAERYIRLYKSILATT